MWIMFGLYIYVLLLSVLVLWEQVLLKYVHMYFDDEEPI